MKSLLMPTYDDQARTGTISQWMKKEREKFQKAETLFVVETVKGVVEVEAPESGTLLRIFVKEGGFAMAGETVALYATEGEQVPPDLLKPPSPASVIIRLLDEKDALVTNASVSIDRENLTLTPQGDFTLAAIPPGTCTIHVKASGFAEKFLIVGLREGEIFRQDLKLISLTKRP